MLYSRPEVSVSSLNRRAFLGASLVSAAALSLPVQAADPIAARCRALRARWTRTEDQLLATLCADATPSPEQREAIAELSRGLGALHVFKEVQHITVEEQVHRSVQALIADIGAAVGAAWMQARRRMDGWLQSADDEDEGLLRAALDSLRAGLDGWELSAVHRGMLESTLAESVADESPGALRLRLHAAARRIDRLRAAAERAARDPARSRRFASADAELTRQVLNSPHHASIAVNEGEAAAQESDYTLDNPDVVVLTALGLLGLAVVFVGGCYVALAGACALVCGDPIGALALLAGLAVVGLAILGGALLVRWSVRQVRANKAQALPPP